MNLKQSFKMIAAVLLASTVCSAGTNSGGGGGFIRQNGQLKTMADAGYIFNKAKELVSNTTYQSYYFLKPETKQALKKLVDELPNHEYWTKMDNDILARGDRSVFVQQTQVNQAEYSKILKDYSNVVKSFSQKLDTSSFVLVAYSDDKKTYILPEFENLTPEQQALNLIHEYNIRDENRQSTELSHYGVKGKTAQEILKRALEIDYMIHAFRKSEKSANDFVTFFTKARELKIYNLINENTWSLSANSIWSELIGQVEEKLGRPLLESDLFLHPGQLQYAKYDDDFTTMDAALVNRFDSLAPEIAKKLSALKFSTDPLTSLGKVRTLKTIWDKNTPLGRESAYTEALANQAAQIAEVVTESQQQCALKGEALTQSDMKYDSLIHYNDATKRVYRIKCHDSSNSGKMTVELIWAAPY